MYGLEDIYRISHPDSIGNINGREGARVAALSPRLLVVIGTTGISDLWREGKGLLESDSFRAGRPASAR